MYTQFDEQRLAEKLVQVYGTGSNEELCTTYTYLTVFDILRYRYSSSANLLNLRVK